ncbi:LOG family protein, partial [Oenococcus oeni]|uniref:LOG family protein n=1 Tax=Oenococcus oeni TaxID=1247 RepID=UPI000A4CD34F
MTSSGQIKSVGVFMGAEFGNEKMFSNKATELGKYLAENNYRLVYGGGKDGLMGIVAMSVMENGGRVLGITPSNMAETSIDADQITELVQTPDMNT